MTKLIQFTILLLVTLFFSAACSHQGDFESQLTKTLEKKPELLMNIIEKNPTLFMETVQKTAMLAKQDAAEKRQVEEARKMEEAMESPFVPVVREDEIIRGTKDAPLVLVEYSDFECPFCKRGFETVKSLMDKYPGKIQFIYKHLPLSFHPQAMVASRYYEAIRLQDHQKAIKFHDLIFDNQKQLANGESFLKKMAKQAGADLKNLEKNLTNKELLAKIDQRIQDDIQEAGKFGLKGTPGFLINGVPVRGAYPPQHFEQIINKLKEKGKVKL